MPYNIPTMIVSQKNCGTRTEAVSLNLSNGFSGRAVTCISGKNFSKADWTECLSQPWLLFENVEKIIKTEGRNCVAVKNLTIAGEQLKVLLKRHYPKASFRWFFRSLRPGKALRNFKITVELLRLGMPTAAAFAALQQKWLLLTKQSIYITEYFDDSPNLYNFASQLDNLSSAKTPADELAIRKTLSYQLADILASLHKNGLWHRDSKATNFIVHKDTKNEYKVMLVDVDGIKRYRLRRRCFQFRSLWLLAASLLRNCAVNRTDYLRTFTAYCNLLGIETSERRRIFRELAILAAAKRRRSVLKAAAAQK